MSAFYAPLNHETLLQIHGPDAQTFLQGQTTCDVRQVNPQAAKPGAYCNPKGRMWADFLLFSLGSERYGLRLRADIADTTRDTFAKYIMFSKAEIEQDPAWQVLACWGPDSASALLTLCGALPDQQYGCVSGEGFCLVQIDRQGQQFELYVNSSIGEDLLQSLASSLNQAPAEQWQLLQIEAGIGRIENSTVASFLPQVLNYDLLSYINFKKGCYTGQEVVARLHYRGKSKRRLYIAKSNNNVPAKAGTEINADQGTQACGTVVNALAAPDGGSIMLVSVAENALDKSLRLMGESDVLSVSPPPYPLEKDA
ncbi:folate-binding protein YgfZ [Parahaliea sp. F7430]|uniref:Folate-binding protein YgfZ n=1 Tax=Sediminihaliea albiluteola TaxID=2758564 RepID=A0A7W2TV78_9GAMM|nr:folate-binding protein YgfZ [Sediminihaliea albiluteola]MBA6412547.1 folate-binding protein YgfZ [Sediminihaliea albiluteola]